MFHKKKQILIILLAVIAIGACITVFRHAVPKGSLLSLMVDEDTYTAIKNARTRSDSRFLDGLWLNERQTFFDEGTDTFYYSVVQGEADCYDPSVTADGTGVRLAVLSDPIDEAFVRSNGTVKLLAYNETDYREYSLKLTSLPLLNIVSGKEISKNFPVTFKMEFFDNRADAPVYYSTSIGIRSRKVCFLYFP